jgi:hypothetical protein
MIPEPLQPWLPLVASLAALVIVHLLVTQRLITLLYRLTHNLPLAMTLYALLVWPGTVLHEVSHWLVAWLLGVRAELPHLLPSGFDEEGRMVLGHVVVERADLLRRSLIGVAPLAAGSGAVALLARFAFELPIPAIEMEGLRSLLPLFEAMPDIMQAPNVWVYLYFLFAIASGMMPSPSDREAWPGLLLFIAIISALLFFTVGIPDLPEGITLGALRAAAWLTFAFVVAVTLNLALLLVLVPLERLFWLAGR